MTDVQITLAKIEGDMKINNVMTNNIQNTLLEIRDDSSSVVALTKGLTVIGRVVVWGGGLTALIGGLIVIGDWYDRKNSDATKASPPIYQSSPARE